MPEFLGGYWAMAAAAAAGFYGWLSWLGRSHLSPAARDELALWLMGAHEAGWARSFCRLFDAVFGAGHLSWRCFVRSSVASVMAVAALWLLFGPVLGVLDDRALGELTLWQALLIGAAVNIVPDYLSLYETRWLLGRFQHVRSMTGQIGLLTLDAVLTGAIIWGGVALFHTVRGLAPPGPVEMLAMFSVFSVFFYSTFLTSAWAWLHCVTLWIMRLFSRTALVRVLDVEEKPAAQLGLVGGIVIFAGAIAVAPLLEPGEDGRTTALDRGLCDLFGGRLCLHVARLSGDEREAYDRLSIYCAEADPQACYLRALDFFGNDADAAASLWRRGCDAGFGESCAYLGDMQQFLYGSMEAVDDATALYRKGCELDHAKSCTSLGMTLEDGMWVPQDLAGAAEAYERGCALGEPGGCTLRAYALQHGRGVTRDEAEALILYEGACAAGEIIACNEGALLEQAAGDAGAEAVFQESACDLGDAAGCLALAEMLESGRGVAAEPERAAELYFEACVARVPGGCARLAALSEVEGLAADADMDTVRRVMLDHRGCAEGSMTSCMLLAERYVDGAGVQRDTVRAKEIYGELCGRRIRAMMDADRRGDDAERKRSASELSVRGTAGLACVTLTLMEMDERSAGGMPPGRPGASLPGDAGDGLR